MDVIKAKQTKDQIVDIIRKEIINGNFKNGMKITQVEMANHLGVSRMPIREAFLILENEGFLKRLPNRHIEIVGLKNKNVLRYIHFLSLIEKDLIDQIRNENIDFDKIINQNSLLQKSVNKQIIYDFHLSLSLAIDDVYISNVHHQLLGGLFDYCLFNTNLNLEISKSQIENLFNNIINKTEISKNTIQKHIYTVMSLLIEEISDA
jgi:DNA-binding GntR family transcriptional regulator